MHVNDDYVRVHAQIIMKIHILVDMHTDIQKLAYIHWHKYTIILTLI